jgi:hypothetical protein
VTGPAQQRLDVSLSKTTTLAGRRSVELRVEAYNVTNTPSFRNPVSDLGAANFGQITRTRGGPRLIQLGIKLRF